MTDSDAVHSFPVHGGTCRVVTSAGGDLPVAESVPEGAVTVELDGDAPRRRVVVHQSIARHLHALHWLLAVVAVSLAVASALTDWRYVSGTGTVVEWYWFLAIGLYGPGVRAAILLSRRLRGFTGARTIPADAVEGVELTTDTLGWYGTTRKTVPLFVVAYRDDGRERRRRILLRPRFDESDVQDGVAAFDALGASVSVDDDAQVALGLDPLSAGQNSTYSSR